MIINKQTHNGKINALILCFLILALSLSVTAVDAKPKTRKVKLKTAKNIAIPRNVNGFVADKPDYFEQSELGAGIQYSHPDFEDVILTLYLYPFADVPVSLEYRVRYEFESNLSDLREVSQTKGLDNAVFDKRLVSTAQHEILVASAELMNMDSTIRSHLYLSDEAYHFKKIRLSYPAHKLSEYAEKLDKTLLDIMQGINFKKSQKMSITMNVAASDSGIDKSDLELQFLYGSLMIAAINDLGLIDSFEREAQVYSALSKLLAEEDDPVEAQDTELWAALVKNDFVREWVWMSFKADYWDEPEGLKLKKYQTWANSQKSVALPLNPSFRLLLESE